MTTSLVIILFWLPIIACALDTLFWYVSYQQHKGFNINGIWKNVTWEFRPPVFTNLQLAIHFGALTVLISSIVFASAFLGVLGIFIIYASWTYRAFKIWDRIINKKLTQVSWDNLTVSYYLLMLILFVSVPVGITAFFSLDPGNLLTFNFIWIYKYAVLLSITFIVYELLMPLFCLIGAIIIQPLVWIIKQNQVKNWNNFKTQHPNTFVIAIFGSYGKSTIASGLQDLLGSTAWHQPNNITSISDLNISRPDAKFLIVNVDFFKPQELVNLFTQLKPNLVVYTGINQEKLALWPSTDNFFAEVNLALNALPNQAMLFINIDDSLSKNIVNTNQNILVEYYTTQGSKAAQNSLKALPDRSEHDNVAQYLFTNNKLKYTLEINHQNINRLHSWAALASIINLIGDANILSDYLSKPLNYLGFEVLNGDNNTKIIYIQGKLSYAKLESAVNFSNTQKAEEIVLICDGINASNKITVGSYQKITSILLKQLTAVISSNQVFINSLKVNNTTTKLIIATGVENKIYFAREYQHKNTIYIINDYNSLKLISQLKSDF